jgi:heavy metal sensor kinase
VSLTTRLSLFFLGLLAVVLVGFSLTLYLLARSYLHGQAEERLQAALDTLVAAAEVGPGGVEWEPAERSLAFRAAAPGEQLVWLVRDGRGRVVDRFGSAESEEFLKDAAEQLMREGSATRRFDGQGGRWLVGQRRLRPAAGDVARSAGTPPHGETRYAALTVTAGTPLGPVQHTLRRLAAALVAVSLGVWLLAFLAGRSVCRRALWPVRCMAASARDMGAADLGRRLPVEATGDELEDLSRSFNGLLDRLQESFERQRRFTGDASHQLRTPLAAVLGQIEVALRRERGADEYRAALAGVQAQAARLHRIVEALLFLARADAEARLPGLETVALEEWLAEYLRRWSDVPRAGDLAAEIDPVGPFWVEIQPEMLGELVGILIENAYKYSPPGSPITVHLGREGEKSQLSVQDRGFGIAKADLPHIFEPFFRSADARLRGLAGSGLGLSIAQRLAVALGSTLSVTSKEGVGSRFTLSLRGQPPAGPQQGDR